MSSTPCRVAIKWLLLGWVTVCGQSIHNQPPRSTQPSITPGYVKQVPACLRRRALRWTSLKHTALD